MKKKLAAFLLVLAFPFIAFATGDGTGPWPFASISRHITTSGLDLENYSSSEVEPYFMTDSDGYQVVLWPSWDGSDFEVAWSKWNGTVWSDPSFLTSNANDDLDPSGWVTAGGTWRVAWDRAGTNRTVYYREKASSWSTEENVSYGRAPALEGTWVGYQVGTSSKTIFAARKTTFWTVNQIGTTNYNGPYGDGWLDLQIHTSNGVTWLDWVNASGQMGYSVLDGTTWGSVQTFSYSWNPPSVTEEQARHDARAAIKTAVGG